MAMEMNRTNQKTTELQQLGQGCVSESDSGIPDQPSQVRPTTHMSEAQRHVDLPPTTTSEASGQVDPFRTTMTEGPSQVGPPPTTTSEGPSQVGPPPTTTSEGPSQVGPPPTTTSEGPSQVGPPPTTTSEGPSQVDPSSTTMSEGPSKVDPPPTTTSEATTQVDPPPTTTTEGPIHEHPPPTTTSEATTHGDPPRITTSEATTHGDPRRITTSEATTHVDPSPTTTSDAKGHLDPPPTTSSGAPVQASYDWVSGQDFLFLTNELHTFLPSQHINAFIGRALSQENIFTRLMFGSTPGVEIDMSGSTPEGFSVPDYDLRGGEPNTLLPELRGVAGMADIDLMIISRESTVGYTSDKDFIMDTTHTHPGYMRLRKPVKGAVNDAICEMDDHHYFSCQRIKQRMTRNPQCMIHLTGPSCMLDSNIGLEMDLVMTMASSEWPREAAEWVRRRRPHGWPTLETRETIMADGCLMVPVAHYLTRGKARECEWRLSFSRAERQLAWSMNETQRKCYILLKVFKDTTLKPPAVLSSYHFKTVLFWACEERPQSLWTPDNLSQCLMFLLDKMLMFVSVQCLPHYFVPTNNLIGHIHPDFLLTLTKKLVEARQNPLRFARTFEEKYEFCFRKNQGQKSVPESDKDPGSSSTNDPNRTALTLANVPKSVQLLGLCNLFGQAGLSNDIGSIPNFNQHPAERLAAICMSSSVQKFQEAANFYDKLGTMVESGDLSGTKPIYTFFANVARKLVGKRFTEDAALFMHYLSEALSLPIEMAIQVHEYLLHWYAGEFPSCEYVLCGNLACMYHGAMHNASQAQLYHSKAKAMFQRAIADPNATPATKVDYATFLYATGGFKEMIDLLEEMVFSDFTLDQMISYYNQYGTSEMSCVPEELQEEITSHGNIASLSIVFAHYFLVRGYLETKLNEKANDLMPKYAKLCENVASLSDKISNIGHAYSLLGYSYASVGNHQMSLAAFTIASQLEADYELAEINAAKQMSMDVI